MNDKNNAGKEFFSDFISNLFSFKFNDYISFKTIPDFSFEKKLTSAEIKFKIDESQKLINEGRCKEAAEILILINKSIGVLNEKINIEFEFECDENKYLLEINKESIYFNFNLYLILDNKAKYNEFKKSLNKKIARFNSTSDSIVFISNEFLDLINQFKDFKFKHNEFIELIQSNSFIEKNTTEYYMLFDKWKNFLKLNNYINGNQYIYNDLDNKALYINDINNEYIYHEDQNNCFLHVIDKNTNNFKLISLNHLFIFNEDFDNISFEDFEKSKNLKINEINDEFINSINESFLLLDSTKGLNIKSEFSNTLKYNIEILHYL